MKDVSERLGRSEVDGTSLGPYPFLAIGVSVVDSEFCYQGVRYSYLLTYLLTYLFTYLITWLLLYRYQHTFFYVVSN
jgi:hypothetical protein